MTSGAVGHLSPAVRARVVALASQAMAGLPADEVPAALRPYARWTASRRAKLAASRLAAVLAADPVFRQRVAGQAREQLPELAGALEAGNVPAAADPMEVAALAYLLRPEGWAEVLAAAEQAQAQARQAAEAQRADSEVAELRAQLHAALAAGEAEQQRLRAELDSAQAEVVELRRQLRRAQEQARRSESEAGRARAELTRAQEQMAEAGAQVQAEVARQQARVAELEAAVEAGRRVAREQRNLDDVRVRLLLDTVLGAAQGLRRELALPPAEGRPADLVAAAAVEPAGAGTAAVPQRALDADDPDVLERLLALPQVHLVVDGYNVTKTGYGTLTLQEQRGRLVTGLAAVAARSGAEVTCVFDGAELTAVPALAAPRGVRVLFSRPGESADELIRRLVWAEPTGRPVVVISADREVAEGVARAGARAVPATALLRLLGRG